MPADPARPIRILELRSVLGTGGGPDKTILLGSARADRGRFLVTVCYIHDLRDPAFTIAESARQLGLDYTEITENHSFDVGIWPQLATLVRERHIDIVHAHDYKTDLLALMLARRTGVIPLATVHGWIWNTWRQQLYNAADVRLLARFPAVIAVSGPIRRALVNAGAPPAHVHQIPNGVDHRRYRKDRAAGAVMRGELGIRAEAVVMGAVGRLSNEKRLDLLLATAAQMTTIEPHVLIVGDGPARQVLADRTRALGLDRRVTFTGTRRDVHHVLQALDVYVQSSDTEGVPNAVLEAMASEVPVVATDVGGTRELIDDGVHGRLIAPGRSDLIAAAVARTLADTDATRRMIASARARVERELSFDVRMARVEALYTGLMQQFREACVS